MSAFYDYTWTLIEELRKPINTAEDLRTVVKGPFDPEYFRSPKHDTSDLNQLMRAVALWHVEGLDRPGI